MFPSPAAQIMLTLGLVIMTAPFIWMVLTSLKAPNEAISMPPKWIPSVFRFDNYAKAWNAAPFFRYFSNSLIVAVVTTSVQQITGLLAAYAFARMKFPGRERIFVLLLSTMMIPPYVLLIPNYVMLSRLGWIDTYKALIVPFFASAFNIFFLRQHIQTIPQDYFDSASIDGCTELKMLFYIVAPMSIPVLLTTSIFTFVASWNSFMWPLIVTNSANMRPLQVGLAIFAQDFTTDWTLLMAASTFAIFPIIIIYFIAQRFFVHGTAASGLKG